MDREEPRPPGRLVEDAERLAAWRAGHRLESFDRLPALVEAAVAETRARTARIVALPEGEVVGCRLVSGAPFYAAGAHEGGLASAIHINRDVPFNLADLLYVVAHEGHPGHIAESVLKEIHLADRPEQRVRFLLSPQGVLSPPRRPRGLTAGGGLVRRVTSAKPNRWGDVEEGEKWLSLLS